ncbi:hypothetical protein HUJ04_008065 [Dendroctonus ponderosae]
MSSNDQKQIASDSNVVGKTSLSVDSKEEKRRSLSASIKIQDFDADGVTLAEDGFAQYFDDNGAEHSVRRFTWKNKNKIQIQVLNYGARVISIKLPDRKGEVEDVLLGFDDLAGYLFYEKFHFGAAIGRTSNIVKNSSFTIGAKKYTVGSNNGKHSLNGGFKGFDQAVWDTHISGKKVIMSHISPHLEEGYPGDLLMRAVFELSAKNEFKVSFEAQTSRPTCVDLSHLLYFNLAGHHTGPDEIYRHILTMNCNCFTPQVNQIPTGEIMNVLHSQFDFQVPKLLGKVMGIVPKDGFDQNLCVNRGMYQQECFVGRMLHPPSGRMMEVYSNQPGVRLNTANHFGYGIILSFEDIQSQSKLEKSEPAEEKSSKTMLLFEKVHEKVVDLLKLDQPSNFSEIKALISKFASLRGKVSEDGFKVTPMQNAYLVKAREIVCENEETDADCLDLKEILSAVLKSVQMVEPPVVVGSKSSVFSEADDRSQKKSSATASPEKSFERVAKENGQPDKQLKSKSEKPKENANIIPVYYRDSNQIRGKGGALYKAHGGVALQTQNYPNAVNLKQFPNCILNPGEVYKHDIVYRFWVRAGNPSKWIRRNLNESNQKTH